MTRFSIIGAATLAACGGTTASTSLSAPADSSAASKSLSSSSSRAADAGAACSGIGGTYQRGKGGGPPNCCPGLTQIRVLEESLQAGNVVCTSFPDYAFICVKGTCGDGICEAPENQRCTCPQDCGGALPDGG